MQRQVTVQEYIQAIRNGDIDTVRAYLAMPEREVNARDGANGQAALMLAVALGDREIANLILEADPSLILASSADLDAGVYQRRPSREFNYTGANFAGGFFNQTPVAQATGLGFDFLRPPSPPLPPRGERLARFARYMEERVQRFLNLRDGAAPGNNNNALRPAVTNQELLAAAREGDAEVVRRYYNENIGHPELFSTVRDRDNHNMTALLLAAHFGHDAVVEVLLSYVVRGELMPLVALINPNETDDLGRTPLMLAAAAGHIEIVGRLLGCRSVDTAMVDREGRTAEQLAAANGHAILLGYIRDMQRLREGRADEQVEIRIFPSLIRDDLYGDDLGPFTSFDADLVHDLYGDLIDIPQEEGGITVRDLLAAARTNNQEIIDVYINQNLNAPGVVVNLQTAAQVANDHQHYDLAAHLTELITDLQRSEQENIAQAAAVKPGNEIKYNANESRLRRCKLVGEIPEKLCCPVATGIMCDPVTVCTGITYERESLVKLMGEKDSCACPFTRGRIMRAELKNNSDVCLLRYIENFVREQENPEHVWDVAALLTCPLSRELFVDPVTVACGLTFEREALKKWFAEKNNPDEMLWQGSYIIKLSEINNSSNVAIKSLVSDYRDKLKAEAQKVRAARLRMFDKPDTAKNSDGGDGSLSLGKRK